MSGDQRDNKRKLYAALEFRVGGHYPPYLFERIITVAGDEDIIYVTTNLRRPGNGTQGVPEGRLVVFTGKLVIVQDVQAEGDKAVIGFRVVRRAALRTLTSDYEAGMPGYGVYGGDEDLVWPYESPISLTYDGLPEPVRIPLDWQVNAASHLREFLPGLVDDLR